MILLYLGGLIGQMMTNYAAWNEAGGILGQALIQMPNPNPLKCFASAFTVNGVKSIGLLLLASAGIFLYVKLSDRFRSSRYFVYPSDFRSARHRPRLHIALYHLKIKGLLRFLELVLDFLQGSKLILKLCYLVSQHRQLACRKKVLLTQERILFQPLQIGAELINLPVNIGQKVSVIV